MSLVISASLVIFDVVIFEWHPHILNDIHIRDSESDLHKGLCLNDSHRKDSERLPILVHRKDSEGHTQKGLFSNDIHIKESL